MILTTHECRNKSYNQADMKSAGCLDDDTVQACSRKLFMSCIHDEAAHLVSEGDKMRSHVMNVAEHSNDALKKLDAWLAQISSTIK